MKILVISDSHGNVENVNRAVNSVEFDHLFFLGDGIKDLGNLVYADNVHFVRGNCDFFSSEKLEEMIELDGVRFLLVHGHTFAVKKGLGALINYAKEEQANFVLFGHTREFLQQNIGDITVLNPGSISNARGGKSTFAVVEINAGKTLVKPMKF